MTGPGLIGPALSAAFDGPVDVERVERVEPWWVWRVHLVSGRTVIVKRLRDDPDGLRTDPARTLTERASLEFLAGLGVDVGPALLAVDEAAGVLVLEDLAPRVSLFDLLRDGDPVAAVGLRAFARAMGALHAATAGHADEYYARRSRLGPINRDRDHRRVLGEASRLVPISFAEFGVDLRAGAEAELAEARRLLFDRGPFIAFSNGDAGADNFLVDAVGSDGRIIDWECGGYRHALLDAAALYVPGPMWMTVGTPAFDGVATAYRDALAAGVADASDDVAYARGLVAACMLVAVERLVRLPTLDGRPAGHESRAQMVSTLESAGRTADSFGAFGRLAGWAHATASELRRRWPDADRTFPDAYTMRER